MSHLSAAAVGTPRLHYLDWLRVFSMSAVFIYHNNRFFNHGDWHVKNPELSLVSTLVEIAMGLWLMPLLFALSGAATFYALRSRGGARFSRDRFLRLGVPLLTLGLFVFGPLQIYLERLTHGNFEGNFWQFLPHYFEGLYGFGGNFAWMGVHLWYLLVLFTFSMLFLGILVPSGKSGMSIVSRLSRYFDKPWALFLLFVPLGQATQLADAVGLGITRGMGGWDILSYMLFFIYGYLVAANPPTILTIRKYAFASLTLAAALSVFWLVMLFLVMPPGEGFFFQDELRGMTAWLWILAALGLGARYLTTSPRRLGYANEAVLPFYILHQPLILLVGFFVVQWSLPVLAKYAVIAVISFVGIMVVYELLVRRVSAMRFLMGMKLKRTT